MRSIAKAAMKKKKNKNKKKSNNHHNASTHTKSLSFVLWPAMNFYVKLVNCNCFVCAWNVFLDAAQLSKMSREKKRFVSFSFMSFYFLCLFFSSSKCVFVRNLVGNACYSAFFSVWFISRKFRNWKTQYEKPHIFFHFWKEKGPTSSRFSILTPNDTKKKLGKRSRLERCLITLYVHCARM